MKCNQCHKEGELQNWVTFSYWYCKDCKCEIFPEEAKADEPTLPTHEGEYWGPLYLNKDGKISTAASNWGGYHVPDDDASDEYDEMLKNMGYGD